MRIASSTAISQKGLIAIFALARSTPVPSDFTLTFTYASTTRLIATRTFMDSPIGSCAGIANFGLIYEVVYRKVYELIRGVLRGQSTFHSALKQPLIMPL